MHVVVACQYRQLFTIRNGYRWLFRNVRIGHKGLFPLFNNRTMFGNQKDNSSIISKIVQILSINSPANRLVINLIKYCV